MTGAIIVLVKFYLGTVGSLGLPEHVLVSYAGYSS